MEKRRDGGGGNIVSLTAEKSGRSSGGQLGALARCWTESECIRLRDHEVSKSRTAWFGPGMGACNRLTFKR